MREQAAVIILTGSRQISSEDLVLRGARGVIHKSEPAEVILKAIERVHQGDTWIDRSAMSRALKAAAARNSSPSERLTRAERRVISAVVQQCNAPNKVIAASLGLSEHTLRNHLAKIYSKLDIRRRIDLVLHARQHFLDLSDARPAGQWHWPFQSRSGDRRGARLALRLLRGIASSRAGPRRRSPGDRGVRRVAAPSPRTRRAPAGRPAARPAWRSLPDSAAAPWSATRSADAVRWPSRCGRPGR